MITDYSEIIEHSLTKLNREFKRFDEYYLAQSPFTDDKNPSFVWYINDGWSEVFNQAVNGKYRLSMRETMEYIGLKEDYLMWACKKYSILYTKLNKFKEVSLDFIKDEYEYTKLKKYILPLCTNEFISFDYIINSKRIEKLTFDKPKSEKHESSITEVDITEDEKKEVEKYIKSRKINLKNNVYPVKLNISGIFTKLAVCFEYENGFKKYRFLSGKFRYMSKGSYNDLFKVKTNNNKQALFIEGEIEALSIEKYINNYDIYSIHNCRAIPDCSISKLYDKVIVLVDKDKFEENKDRILLDLKNTTKENCIIEVNYKLEEKNEDFNSLLINNENKLKIMLDKLNII